MRHRYHFHYGRHHGGHGLGYFGRGFLDGTGVGGRAFGGGRKLASADLQFHPIRLVCRIARVACIENRNELSDDTRRDKEETVRIAAYSQLPGRFLSCCQVLRCAGPLPAQREDDQHDNHDDYDCSDADIHKVPFISAVRLPHCPQRVRPNQHARIGAPTRRPRAAPRAAVGRAGSRLFHPIGAGQCRRTGQSTCLWSCQDERTQEKTRD